MAVSLDILDPLMRSYPGYTISSALEDAGTYPKIFGQLLSLCRVRLEMQNKAMNAKPTDTEGSVMNDHKANMAAAHARLAKKFGHKTVYG